MIGLVKLMGYLGHFGHLSDFLRTIVNGLTQSLGSKLRSWIGLTGNFVGLTGLTGLIGLTELTRLVKLTDVQIKPTTIICLIVLFGLLIIIGVVVVIMLYLDWRGMTDIRIIISSILNCYKKIFRYG